MKVELDLSNYATKANLKNATGVEASKFAKNVDFASLKSEVEKLNIDKLEKVPTGLNSLKSKADESYVNKLAPVPVDLSKLCDAVKNEVVKKTEYNELVKNVNALKTTNTINLVKKLITTRKLVKLKKKKKIIDNDHSNNYITT